MSAILFVVLAFPILLTTGCRQNTRKPEAEERMAGPTDTVSLAKRAAVAWMRMAPAGTEQMLTSNKMFTNTSDNADETPIKETYLFPGDDIGSSKVANWALRYYNGVNTFNRMVHCYELFNRLASGEDSTLTRRDTLEWMRAARLSLPDKLLKKALPDAELYETARQMVRVFSKYDGSEQMEDILKEATDKHIAMTEQGGQIIGTEQLDAFEQAFWPWYDKAACVPEIDSLVAWHVSDKAANPEIDVNHIVSVIKGEPDIDRRAILALELVQIDASKAIPLLADIMESGIYTKYLLEVWCSWRANMQSGYYGASSFSLIPNTYYDKARVHCLKTFIRHCQNDEKDINARCLMVNLIATEIIHRQGWLFGNEAGLIVGRLADKYFIHPRLMTEK